MTQLYDHLKSITACQSALDWIDQRTAQQAWDECERADWLLWWLVSEHKYGSEGYRDAVRAAADCAETAIQYCKTDKQRSIITTALAAVRKWVDEPSEQNRAYARRAYAAAVAVADDAAAAAYTADAAYAVADAAAYAAATAAYTAYAAGAAAYATAKHTAHLKMCALIRARIPLAPWKETA